MQPGRLGKASNDSTLYIQYENGTGQLISNNTQKAVNNTGLPV
jgi:hypothetical protein